MSGTLCHRITRDAGADNGLPPSCASDYPACSCRAATSWSRSHVEAGRAGMRYRRSVVAIVIPVLAVVALGELAAPGQTAATIPAALRLRRRR